MLELERANFVCIKSYKREAGVRRVDSIVFHGVTVFVVLKLTCLSKRNIKILLIARIDLRTNFKLFKVQSQL